jgi:hypothetical protein
MSRKAWCELLGSLAVAKLILSDAECLLCAQTMLVRPAPLTVRGVFAALHSMAAQKGAGATKRRTSTILQLLRSCRCAACHAGALLVCAACIWCRHALSGCERTEQEALPWYCCWMLLDAGSHVDCGGCLTV